MEGGSRLEAVQDHGGCEHRRIVAAAGQDYVRAGAQGRHEWLHAHLRHQVCAPLERLLGEFRHERERPHAAGAQGRLDCGHGHVAPDDGYIQMQAAFDGHLFQQGQTPGHVRSRSTPAGCADQQRNAGGLGGRHQ